MAVVTVLHTEIDPFYQCIQAAKVDAAVIKHHAKQPRAVPRMSETLSTQQEVQKGIKRTRRSHNKVRTGCLTCKIRRKKCDETRPSCTRCTSTGRKCDGYPLPEPLSTTDSHEQRQPTSPTVESSIVVQVAKTFSPSEPRIIELDEHDGSSDDVHPNVDDRFDESEVTDFIVSYPSSTLSGASTSPPTPEASTSTTVTSSGQSRSFLSNEHSPTISVLHRSPNFFSPSNAISSIDASCFSFFKHVTGPTFASYFDSSMWRTYTAGAALAHPIVFAAATAVGAVHQRFNYGISREAFEYCGHAARLYAKAARQLEQLKNQHVNRNMLGTKSAGGQGWGVSDRDAIMLCEMLLGLFEGFQQNYAEAVGHLNNGLKYLLRRPMTLMHSETRYYSIESEARVFQQLFSQLERRSVQIFGSETKILAQRDVAPLPEIPRVFSSLDEAKDFLFTEVDWIMHAPEEAWSNRRDRGEAQSLHVERLIKWGVSYAETIKDMDRTPRQKLACKLMKTTRNATHLLLFMTLFNKVDFELPTAKPDKSKGSPKGGTSSREEEEDQPDILHDAHALYSMVQNRDYLLSHLARLQVLAESVLNDSSLFRYDEHSVSFDSAIGPPQRPDCMPDSSAKTRHLVKTFLKNSAKSSALWEMLGVYGVAEKVSAV